MMSYRNSKERLTVTHQHCTERRRRRGRKKCATLSWQGRDGHGHGAKPWRDEQGREEDRLFGGERKGSVDYYSLLSCWLMMAEKHGRSQKARKIEQFSSSLLLLLCRWEESELMNFAWRRNLSSSSQYFCRTFWSTLLLNFSLFTSKKKEPF